MMNLVLDLQKKALDSNSSITDLLRTALTVAIKLDINDFAEWIKHELYGYYNVDSKDIPKYRFVSGVAKYHNPYHGWCDVHWATQKQYDNLSRILVIDRISEIEELTLSDNMIFRDFSVSMQRYFAKENLGMIPKIILNKHDFIGILDVVKNNILSWALDLEKKGILGENMTFNEDEHRAAKTVTINNYIERVEHSYFQQGETNHMNVAIDGDGQKKILSLLEEIKEMLSEIHDTNIHDEISVDVTTIEQQMKSPNPKMGIVYELLRSIRNILEGTCGSLLASYPAIDNGLRAILG